MALSVKGGDAMHAIRFLRTHLRHTCPTVHAKRFAVLLLAVETVTRYHRLTLTALGRALRSAALVKHNIKRMDRLLGNRRLERERTRLYAALAQWMLTGLRQPILVIDWADLTPNRHWQLLRASVPVGGRALTVYEEVHPLRLLTNRRVHRAFLAQLAWLLPDGLRPIVVTDAGFRGTWFRLVEAQGWEWVGRIRNRTLVQHAEGEPWLPCKQVYAAATPRPTMLGEVLFIRSHPLRCTLHLVRQPTKGRHQKSVFGQPVRSSHSRKQTARAREPWLLASSLGLRGCSAKRIMQIYRQRMQIEEAFRDLKSERYGLGFAASQTRAPQRLAILLLIGALALFLLWLVGQAAVQQNLHHSYQANTMKRRLVLSVVSLGRHFLSREPGVITISDLVRALARLRLQLLQDTEE